MSYLPPSFADLTSAVQPGSISAPDTYLPAQPGITAVVVECVWCAADDMPTPDDVRVDRPAVFAWRVRPPASHRHKLTVEPVLAASPFYAEARGQGAVVEVLVPDDKKLGALLRSRRHNGTTLEGAKRAVLHDARAKWRWARARAEARRSPVPAARSVTTVRELVAA